MPTRCRGRRQLLQGARSLALAPRARVRPLPASHSPGWHKTFLSPEPKLLRPFCPSSGDEQCIVTAPECQGAWGWGRLLLPDFSLEPRHQLPPRGCHLLRKPREAPMRWGTERQQRNTLRNSERIAGKILTAEFRLRRKATLCRIFPGQKQKEEDGENRQRKRCDQRI